MKMHKLHLGGCTVFHKWKNLTIFYVIYAFSLIKITENTKPDLK